MWMFLNSENKGAQDHNILRAFFARTLAGRKEGKGPAGKGDRLQA